MMVEQQNSRPGDSVSTQSRHHNCHGGNQRFIIPASTSKTKVLKPTKTSCILNVYVNEENSDENGNINVENSTNIKQVFH